MATKKLTSAQQARENLKRKNPKYKAYREKKELARAEQDAKIKNITNLIIAGKDREAYREFETLPLVTQATVLVTPVIGDAIAAYEVGEFGTRAEERFAQNDILGGLGNKALQTMAGISLLPIVGPVGDVLGKGFKSFGKAFKTDPELPAGGGGTSVSRPNEYPGTRPVDLGDDIGFQPGTGLISPNRLALSEMDQPMKLDALVAKLRKAAPNKEGELRMLGLLDDKNQVTPLARKYFAGQEKISPAALDQFLSFKQGTALNVVRPKKADFASPGYGDIDNASEVQRIYQVEGVNTGLKKSGRHYEQLGLKNDIAFDSTDLLDDGVLRVGRIQSDYDPLLKELRDKEAASIKSEVGSFSSPSRQDINPFELPDKPTTVKSLKGEPGYDEIGKLLEKFNESVDSYNFFSTKNLKGIYGADGLPIATPKLIKKSTKADVKAQNFETSKQNDLLFEIGEAVAKLENSVTGTPSFGVGSDILKGEVSFVRELITDRLPKTAQKIADRELSYKNLDVDTYNRTGKLTTDLDVDYYGIARSENNLKYENNPKLDVKPQINIEETLKKIDRLFTQKQGIDVEKNAFFNTNKPKLDPYAGIGAKSTKSYVLPVRNLMNESLQNPNIKSLVFEGIEPLRREGGEGSKMLEKYYQNVQDEAIKVVNEIAEDSDMFVVKQTDDDIIIDLDTIRQYLKNTGEEVKISAFKSGGSVNIQSLLDNL